MGDDVTEPDLLVFLGQGQMRVITSGLLFERMPSLDGDLAIGFRCKHQDRLAGVDIGIDARLALGDVFIEHAPIERTEIGHIMRRVPANPLATIAKFFEERAE